MRVLLVYATTHGRTAKIAIRLAEALGGEGVEVDVNDVKQVGDASPRDYDGVIAGGSLHGGRHQAELVDWVKHHHLELSDRPSLFFSVSLTAAEDTDEARAATQDCIDDFLDDTGWLPTRHVPVAGALQYREYDVFTRVLMRLMMRRGGHPTDTAQDYDYTDWEAVEQLGRDFAGSLQA